MINYQTEILELTKENQKIFVENFKIGIFKTLQMKGVLTPDHTKQLVCKYKK